MASVRRASRTALLVLVALVPAPRAIAHAAGRRYRPPLPDAATPSYRLRRCPPAAHGKVLRADAEAVVYEALIGEPGGGDVFGCTYKYRRAYDFGSGPAYFDAAGGGGIEEIRLAGHIVAYNEAFSGKQTEEEGAHLVRASLVVRDLRDGKRLDDIVGGASAIVLKSDGALAWIAGDQVDAKDKSGLRVLAKGPYIERRWLRLTRSTVRWREGCTRFSERRCRVFSARLN